MWRLSLSFRAAAVLMMLLPAACRKAGTISSVAKETATGPGAAEPSRTLISVDLPAMTAEMSEAQAVEIENALAGIPSLAHIRSVGLDGECRIWLEPVAGADRAAMMSAVHARVAGIRERLPADASVLVDETPTMLLPVASVVAAGAADIETSRAISEVIERELRPRLQAIAGVQAVEQWPPAARERTIVRLDPNRLAAHGIALSEVARAVAPSQRGGVSTSRPAQPIGVAELSETVIAAREGAIVRLRDVAVVERGRERIADATTRRSEDGTAIAIFLKSGADLETVRREAAALIDQIRSRMSQGLRIQSQISRELMDAAARRSERQLPPEFCWKREEAGAAVQYRICPRGDRLIRISDPDMQKTAAAASMLCGRLRSIVAVESVVECQTTRSEPRITFSMDRKAAARLQVMAVDVAEALAACAGGAPIGGIRDGDRTLELVLACADVKGPESWSGVYLRTKEGKLVPLSAVATAHRGMASAPISRFDRQRVSVISLTFKPGQSSQGIGDVKRLADEVASSSGVRVAMQER